MTGKSCVFRCADKQDIARKVRSFECSQQLFFCVIDVAYDDNPDIFFWYRSDLLMGYFLSYSLAFIIFGEADIWLRDLFVHREVKEINSISISDGSVFVKKKKPPYDGLFFLPNYFLTNFLILVRSLSSLIKDSFSCFPILLILYSNLITIFFSLTFLLRTNFTGLRLLVYLAQHLELLWSKSLFSRSLVIQV